MLKRSAVSREPRRPDPVAGLDAVVRISAGSGPDAGVRPVPGARSRWRPAGAEAAIRYGGCGAAPVKLTFGDGVPPSVAAASWRAWDRANRPDPSRPPRGGWRSHAARTRWAAGLGACRMRLPRPRRRW